MIEQQVAFDCRTEVIEAHRFFTEWFTGVLPETDATWSAFEDTLAPGFHLVAPHGVAIPRDQLLAGIRSMHGKHAGAGFKIWIEDFACRYVGAETVVATYEEWQDQGGEVRGRLSTVVFERNPAMPNHVRWLHVHETWLPRES
jgi:hypothetical protein